MSNVTSSAEELPWEVFIQNLIYIFFKNLKLKKKSSSESTNFIVETGFFCQKQKEKEKKLRIQHLPP